MLSNLKLLDLSCNLIDDIPAVQELPRNLASIDLRENRCVVADNSQWTLLSERLQGYLRNLNQLNGKYLNGVNDKV